METAEERFWSKVSKTANCWNWTGCILKAGYGQFYNKKKMYTHRYSYELHKGLIPEGLVLDHLCRNRACCNPEHLEAVTNKVNIGRGIWTKKGVKRISPLKGKKKPWAPRERNGYCLRGHVRLPKHFYKKCPECHKMHRIKWLQRKKLGLI